MQQEVATISSESPRLVPGQTFDASRLPEPQREQFHRNLRAVEQVLAGAQQTQVAKDAGIPRSTLSRLIKRTKLLGTIACWLFVILSDLFPALSATMSQWTEWTYAHLLPRSLSTHDICHGQIWRKCTSHSLQLRLHF